MLTFKLGVRHLLQWLSSVLCVVTLIGGICVAQTPPSTVSASDSSLKNFLQDYLRNPRLSDDPTTRFISAQVHLETNGEDDVVAYVSGKRFCGSGGCVMLILKPVGRSFKVVSKTTIVQLPIRMLESTARGWHDLSVKVHGGGIQNAYDAMLRFDGQRYPGNPTVSPARRLTESQGGQILIPTDAEGSPLYDGDSTTAR